MKKCRNCGEEKSEFEFHQRLSNSDGLYSYCKLCCRVKNRESYKKNKIKHNEISREYRKKNREKLLQEARKYYYRNREKQLEKRAEYRKKNKEKISLREALKRVSDESRFGKNRKRHFDWAKDNREKLNEYQRKWYQKNKEKRRAHVILNRAVKSGKIMRPNSCSQCNKKCKPDGHHTDYNHPLDVVWICRACHSRKSPRTVIRCIY
jgi:hypothetical protein